MASAFGFLAAFVLTAVLTRTFMRRAPRWGLVALPDARRLHAGAIPVVGGLAMGLAFLAALFATQSGDDQPFPLALPAAVVLTLVGGVLDDRFELRSSIKFAFQIAAAALLAWGGDVLLTHLGELMSPTLFTLGRAALPLTIFAIVGVMNALNMADGVDGLAATYALCACLGFGVAAASGGNVGMFGAICLTGGAALGFLVFNACLPGRGPAPVYMGDAGSLLLGLLLAWFAIGLAMYEQSSLSPITAVWLLSLPIADTVTIMTRRLLRGRSPFAGDREHLHHILMALGLHVGQIVAAITAVSLALILIALVAQYRGVREHVMFYIYVTGLVLYGISAEVLCRRLGLRRQTR
jgi:UDP-GlcNAc:undecaprenyl-phosphate GlcNAc-1-phosphate transferase